MSVSALPAVCIASADPALRQRAAAVFAGQAYEARQAASLAELIAAAGDLACAVVDSRMPELQPAPASRLRAEPALHRCPLVLLSAADIAGLAAPAPDAQLIGLMQRIHTQLVGNEQLELLRNVNATLMASHDMEHTVSAVLDSLALALPFDTATLFMLNRQGRLVIRAVRGYTLQPDSARTFAVGEGVVGWVVQNVASTIVGDSDLDQRFAGLDGRSSRSMLCVPIVVGERVVGATSLVRRAPAEQFTDSDLVLVETIGNSAAIALENARLYEEERALAMRLEELNQLYGQEREIMEQLEQYDRLYTDVVATVSHELKTPLTGIRGFAEMIRDRVVDGDEAVDFANEIYENSVRLTTYVESILREDAVHHGRVTLDVQDVHLGPRVEQVVRSLSPAASEAHSIVIDLPEDLPTVAADPDKVTQIILNLVSNAIKYSPQGGTVHVSAAVRGDDVELVVADEGIGIPEEALHRIFERFYRVDSYETNRVSGTGLGLSIVRGLVELHGGSIWATSTMGRGSQFHVTLPVSGAPAAGAATRDRIIQTTSA